MLDEALYRGAGLVVCGGVALFLWGFVVSAVRWTAGPMLAASDTESLAKSFRLTDLIWLLLQLQLAMAAVSYAFPREMPGEMRATAMVLLTLPVAIFWLASVLIVSRARIERPLRRAVVFVVLMPGVVVTLLGAPLLAVGLLQALQARHSGEVGHSNLGTLALQLAGLAVFSLVLRVLALWTVSPMTR